MDGEEGSVVSCKDVMIKQLLRVISKYFIVAPDLPPANSFPLLYFVEEWIKPSEESSLLPVIKKRGTC